MKLRCPTCKKEIEYDIKNPFRPFCSERCQLIDLGKWASEDYKIPVNAAPEDEIPQIDIDEE
ncbi:MAG: DNA gyrase inhibitor YacG [Bdellovibrionia bacterium]